MAFQLSIAFTVAILVVTQQRVAGEGRMDPNLMRPPGRDVHLHQCGERTEELHRLEDADRVLAGCGNPDVSTKMREKTPWDWACMLAGHYTFPFSQQVDVLLASSG